MEVETPVKDRILVEKREELKALLAAGHYKTLGRLIADKVGSFIRTISRNPQPLPFWYTISVIFLCIQIIGYGIVILVDGYYLPPEIVYFEIAISALSLIFIITLEIYIGYMFRIFRQYLLDGMVSIADLNDLQRRTTAVFLLSNQFAVAVFYTLLISLWAWGIAIAVFNVFSAGLIFIGIVRNFFGGIYFYFFIRGIPLLLQLRKYKYKTYAADPSSSEVVDILSDMLSVGVYIVAIFATLLTAIAAFIRPAIPASGLVILLLLGWVPTIAFFVTNQFVLSGIIIKAKRKTLNEIQAQVEELHSKEPILNAETLGHIDKIMDYHDRIKSTRNSALDLRSTLNFLNSLLLPVIAFILANLQQIIDFFF